MSTAKAAAEAASAAKSSASAAAEAAAATGLTAEAILLQLTVIAAFHSVAAVGLGPLLCPLPRARIRTRTPVSRRKAEAWKRSVRRLAVKFDRRRFWRVWPRCSAFWFTLVQNSKVGAGFGKNNGRTRFTAHVDPIDI